MSGLLQRCLVGSLFAILLWPTCGKAQLKKTDLKKADREQWNQILKIPSDCEEAFSNTVNKERDYSGLQFYRLNSSEYLVSVQCYPGAYQPGIIFFLLKERPNLSAIFLKLRGFDSEDNQGNPLPYSMIDGLEAFDPKTGTLEIFSKSRGMGDCGSFARYHYKRGKFTLFEFREQACSETGNLGSTDYRHWPLIEIHKRRERP